MFEYFLTLPYIWIHPNLEHNVSTEDAKFKKSVVIVTEVLSNAITYGVMLTKLSRREVYLC